MRLPLVLRVRSVVLAHGGRREEFELERMSGKLLAYRAALGHQVPLPIMQSPSGLYILRGPNARSQTGGSRCGEVIIAGDRFVVAWESDLYWLRPGPLPCSVVPLCTRWSEQFKRLLPRGRGSLWRE